MSVTGEGGSPLDPLVELVLEVEPLVDPLDELVEEDGSPEELVDDPLAPELEPSSSPPQPADAAPRPTKPAIKNVRSAERMGLEIKGPRARVQDNFRRQAGRTGTRSMRPP